MTAQSYLDLMWKHAEEAERLLGKRPAHLMNVHIGIALNTKAIAHMQLASFYHQLHLDHVNGVLG